MRDSYKWNCITNYILSWYVVLNYPTKLVVIVLIASSVSAGRLIIKEDKHNLDN